MIIQLTGIAVGVGAKEYAEAGLVVDRLAGVVALAGLEAVGEHEAARYGLEEVRGGREDVAGDELEAHHFRVALVRAGRGAGVVRARDSGGFRGGRGGRGADEDRDKGREERRPQASSSSSSSCCAMPRRKRVAARCRDSRHPGGGGGGSFLQPGGGPFSFSFSFLFFCKQPRIRSQSSRERRRSMGRPPYTHTLCPGRKRRAKQVRDTTRLFTVPNSSHGIFESLSILLTLLFFRQTQRFAHVVNISFRKKCLNVLNFLNRI